MSAPIPARVLAAGHVQVDLILEDALDRGVPLDEAVWLAFTAGVQLVVQMMQLESGDRSAAGDGGWSTTVEPAEPRAFDCPVCHGKRSHHADRPVPVLGGPNPGSL